MAEIAVDAVIGYLLQSLVDFINYNLELIGGAEDSLKKLCNELGELKEFVKLCTEEYDSGYLDELAKSVRNLVYKAEDAVERFVVEAAAHRLRGRLDKLRHKAEYKLKIRNLAEEIEEISKEVHQFQLVKAPLGFQAMAVLQEKLKLPERGQKPPISDTVVGIEDEAVKVIDLLTKGVEQLDVVSIVGMYGLGKTTLAKKVFNDQRIEHKFFVCAFVEVSHDFKIKEVLLKIIDCFADVTEDKQKMKEDKLIKFINEYLTNRKYLIVLDDVCSEEAWNQLQEAFPINNNKLCRVLITTRESNVATHSKRISEPHRMRELYYYEAQDLLRLRVFDDTNACPPDPEVEISILTKCDGLPLAVVLIAGMLRNHPEDANYWSKVAHGVKDYDPKVKAQANYVIELSYNRLPYDLKNCFLYLGVFREDSEISARTLMQLWVSEGLIPPSCNEDLTLEDIAEYYLQNLVDRSLVIVQKRSSKNLVKTIKIHDTLREFCKTHAKKENLFCEIKGAGAVSNKIPDDHRRLCINSGIVDFIHSKPSGTLVRSFLCFSQEHYTLPSDKISTIPRAFKLLRILDIRSLKLTCFPADIYCLVLLKYIAISCDDKSLPEEMSALSNLQTLIILTSPNAILKIKADLSRMWQLRHLETNATAILAETSEGSRKNENIQTLSTISPESCKTEVFDRAPMLRKLGIRGRLALLFGGNSKLGISFSNITRLQKLENLKLLNDTTEKISMFPSREVFPSNLVKLTLLNTLLDWEHMSTLGKLKLQVLKLKDNAFEGRLWSTEDGGFKHLKVLHIGKTNLCVWKAASSHFPELTHLYIKNCSMLSAIPQGFKDTAKLQTINLYSTNKGLVSFTKALNSDKKFKLIVYPPEE